jgi:hypothetical protein
MNLTPMRQPTGIADESAYIYDDALGYQNHRNRRNDHNITSSIKIRNCITLTVKIRPVGGHPQDIEHVGVGLGKAI